MAVCVLCGPEQVCLSHMISDRVRCMQGLRQAKDIGSKFGLPGNVLPQILSGGYLHVIQELVSQTEGETAAASLPSRPAPCGRGFSSRSRSAPQASAAQPGVGSAEWRQQLELIRAVCRSAAVDHSIIDGFLSSGCPERQGAQAASTSQRTTASGVSQHQPAIGNAADFDSQLHAFGDDVGFGDMDTDLVDGLMMPAWAP